MGEYYRLPMAETPSHNDAVPLEQFFENDFNDAWKALHPWLKENLHSEDSLLQRESESLLNRVVAQQQARLRRPLVDSDSVLILLETESANTSEASAPAIPPLKSPPLPPQTEAQKTGTKPRSERDQKIVDARQLVERKKRRYGHRL